MSKTRIIEAIQRLDLHTTRELLKTNPSLLTVHNRQGRNLLHLACGMSCKKLRLPESTAVRMVDFLLDCGMDIEKTNLTERDPCPPLFFAVAHGRNLEVVKRLIKRGAKPSRAPGGCLFAAGWWDDVKILDVLLCHGADIDIVVGGTPFMASIHNSS